MLTTDETYRERYLRAIDEVKANRARVIVQLHRGEVQVVAWSTERRGVALAYLSHVEIEFLLRSDNAERPLVAPRIAVFSQLKKLGIVRGEIDHEYDRRRFVCELTAKGRKILPQLRRMLSLLRLGAA